MVIHPGMNEAYRPIVSDNRRFKVIYGGAGSGKSVFVAQWFVLMCIGEAGHSFLCVRKVARTLRFSVFLLIRNVIGDMGLTDYFEVNKSDMTITCLANSNRFLFLGLDDVEKLKSIVGITDIWIEEASEVSKEDFEQINLRLRGITKVNKQIVLTFNPIINTHWLKAYFFDIKKDNTTILKTTYKDNKFLDDEYIAELQDLKNKDKYFYQVYALGEWGQLGNRIYTNYIVEDIPTDENGYSAIYYGLDFGYNDPSALCKVGVKDDELYILDELYQTHLDNSQLIDICKEKITRDKWIIADSAEPARIQEFKKAGFKIRPCTKGKDSVRFGIDFVKRHKMHIHPSCINFINEIQSYKYREDKDGNVLDEPVDFNNHLLDALRYATELMRMERRKRNYSGKGARQ
ncbi:MAG: PBSX family phage terminase large subunit [Clostridiales bacterium]|nr:PBSX family phage terminase large subunit [Clostridiales bacterium]